MEQGMIVLLNGTSSSGKTSISNELINQKEILFHHLSVDDFVKGFFNHTFTDIEPARELGQEAIAQIMFGPLITTYYSTVKLFSEMGLNVIVDTVIDNDKWFNQCLELFADQPVLFVGVICSKEELIRREQLRGDRNIGLAAAQFSTVYSMDEYDLKVHTEEMSPSECAGMILDFIRSGKEYTVFKQLHKRDVSVS
ncbi:phosphotransferase-like protein [Paenibacillus sp. MMS20-IR301]|uniref:chloramphenicol phosphotransferase CPT family protein n=1 Tax=Paenibacillus sp. MMS20-IR301 TaxID=2895946 RepID=UPI0028F0EE9D|nr:chemotaxis protein [Paenibacillus sp. MMS20-IR301]WNS44107.1 chemotaxis protein [Paenibacillus sp. MMS20-IR301]